MKQRNGKSFYRWLVQQEHRNDIVGDLADDVQCDDDFPKKARNLETLLKYLQSRSACDGAIDAMREAHEEWSNSWGGPP